LGYFLKYLEQSKIIHITYIKNENPNTYNHGKSQDAKKTAKKEPLKRQKKERRKEKRKQS
jgi:hypothetical protein